MFDLKMDLLDSVLDSVNFKGQNNIVHGLLDVVHQTDYSSEGHYFCDFTFAVPLNLRE